MRVEIGRAEPEWMDGVRALVDTVFPQARPLARRFPNVLDGKARNVFAARIGDEVVAAVATRPFDWRRGTAAGRAAMIGLVATAAEHRRRGIASALLEAAAEGIATDGIEAAVLWTTQPELYRRLGWRSADPGLLGVVSGGGESKAPRAEPLTREVAEALEPHRRAAGAIRVERRAVDWATVPPPAEAVVVYRAEDGYALVGARGRSGYVYELEGDGDGLAALGPAIRRDFETILVNAAPDSEAHRVLSRQDGVAWEPKPLGMWLALGPGASAVEGEYVPYLDRI